MTARSARAGCARFAAGFACAGFACWGLIVKQYCLLGNLQTLKNFFTHSLNLTRNKIMSCSPETKRKCQEVDAALERAWEESSTLKQKMAEHKATQLRSYKSLCHYDELLHSWKGTFESRQNQKVDSLESMPHIGLWELKHTKYLCDLTSAWGKCTSAEQKLLIYVARFWMKDDDAEEKVANRFFQGKGELTSWRCDCATFPLIAPWFEELASTNNNKQSALHVFFNSLVIAECKAAEFHVEMFERIKSTLQIHLELYLELNSKMEQEGSDLDQILLIRFPLYRFDLLPYNLDVKEVMAMHIAVQELKLENRIKEIPLSKDFPNELQEQLGEALSHHSGCSGSCTIANLRRLYAYGWLHFVKVELQYNGILSD